VWVDGAERRAPHSARSTQLRRLGKHGALQISWLRRVFTGAPPVDSDPGFLRDRDGPFCWQLVPQRRTRAVHAPKVPGSAEDLPAPHRVTGRKLSRLPACLSPLPRSPFARRPCHGATRNWRRNPAHSAVAAGRVDATASGRQSAASSMVCVPFASCLPGRGGTRTANRLFCQVSCCCLIVKDRATVSRSAHTARPPFVRSPSRARQVCPQPPATGEMAPPVPSTPDAVSGNTGVTNPPVPRPSARARACSR